MDQYQKKKPLSWEELRQIIESGNLEVFGRSKRIQLSYDKYLRDVKENWESLDDSIFHHIWGYPYIVDAQSGKKKLLGPVHFQNHNIVFRKNRFHYALKRGIQHYVIWNVKMLNDDEIRTIIEFNQPGRQYLYFINPPSLRSVKNILHWHVFILH